VNVHELRAPDTLRLAPPAPVAWPTAAPKRSVSGVDVSVVVPTRQRPYLLERCLTALVTQTLAPPRYEIIVCDDGPHDATRSLVERFAAAHRARGLAVHYLPIHDTRGPAAARNAGWRHARAPVIAFTDDDTIADPHWLEAGLAAMTPEAAAACGAIVVPIPTHPTDYEADASGLERAEFATANAFVTRMALTTVGGFDERFTAAWREDSDLQFALMRAGGDIVRASAAVVVHPVRPARWGVSLAQQKKSCFEALLYGKYHRLYKRHIARKPPLNYYAILLAAVSAVLGATNEAQAIAVAGGCVWFALTACFFAQRMRGRSRDWKHVAEMAVTSSLIPFLAIYWRIYGAIRYRTWFL
jgi:glycosyltransferase involved in cell wall biosynthesis